MICRAGPAARADREDAAKELSLDEHRHMQVALMIRPEQGAVIRGSGDLRKTQMSPRWPAGSEKEPRASGPPGT